MEFIKKNTSNHDTLGRYKYVFSSDNNDRLYFNTPTTFDSESNRWFSQFQYTYCTFNGFCEAADSDMYDIGHFWDTHSDACFRETYYEWEYQDESRSNVHISYTVTEYSDGIYFRSEFEINDVTEEQFATMDRALLNWHKTGELVISGVKVKLTCCGENLHIGPVYEQPEINTAELIEGHLPVDRETVLLDLKARTTIQEELHDYIAETICRVCREFQSSNADAQYDAHDIYRTVVNDPGIKPHTWVHKDLEYFLTDPIPFA